MTDSQSAPYGPPGAAGTGEPAGAGQAPRGGSPDGGGERLKDQGAAAAFASFANRAWLAVMAVAAGVFAAGLILLLWPHATVVIVALLLGASLIITGVMKLVEGFTARDASGGRRAAAIVIGLVAIVAGLYCLRHYNVTVFLLAFVVGVFWIIHGAADLGVAISRGPVPGRGFRAFIGFFSLVAGLVVLFWPGISVLVLLTVLGAWLMLYGIVLGGLALRMQRTGHALGSGAGA